MHRILCHPLVDLQQRALQGVVCIPCLIVHDAHSISIHQLIVSLVNNHHLRSASSNQVQFAASAFHIAFDPPLVSIDLESLHIVVGC